MLINRDIIKHEYSKISHSFPHFIIIDRSITTSLDILIIVTDAFKLHKVYLNGINLSFLNFFTLKLYTTNKTNNSTILIH